MPRTRHVFNKPGHGCPGVNQCLQKSSNSPTNTHIFHPLIRAHTHKHTQHTALTHSHTLTHICKCTFAGAPPCTQLELSTHAHTATMYSYGTFQKQRYEDLLKAEIKIHLIFFSFFKTRYIKHIWTNRSALCLSSACYQACFCISPSADNYCLPGSDKDPVAK